MFSYREEIDGLRCLAVLPVIFYHAGYKKYFSGGYVGVDIFFVISGYLITQVINNEFKDNQFSIINFYERRIRRIFPCLILILLISSLLAYVIMYDEQLKDYSYTLLSILIFSSNLYFWFKDDGYFSQLSELNPLVHTWSLAVEEQFYLVYPLLFYLFYRRLRIFFSLLIFLSIFSLLFAQWGNNFSINSFEEFQWFSQHRYASFYLPFGRIWELLLGAFVAFYLSNHDSNKKIPHKLKELFSIIGLLFVISSVVFLNDVNIPPFPNLYTLIPTLGASLIILFGEKGTLVGYLLSLNFFRWIGLISYSLYLWHQPLLAYVRLYSNETPQMNSILIIVISIFPLSFLSYLYIEQPFRDKKRFSRKQIFLSAGILTLIILIIGVSFIKTANKRSSLNDKGDDSYLSDLRKYGNWQYVVRDFDRLAARKRTFTNQTSSSKRKVLIIGDSFAQDFYNMIIEGKHLNNSEFCVHFIYSRCQIYFGQEDRLKFIEKKHHQTCAKGNHIKNVLPILRQANLIFLVSNWYLWSAERLNQTIYLLNITKQQQVFVIGPKHFGHVKPYLYINKTKSFRIKQYQYPKYEVILVNRVLEKTIEKSIYVNVQNLVCKGYNHTCPLFTPDGKLISHDGAHLTRYGARYVGNIIFNNKPLNTLK